jgi:hypothetical protein
MADELVTGFTEHLKIVTASSMALSLGHELLASLQHAASLLGALCLPQPLPGDESYASVFTFFLAGECLLLLSLPSQVSTDVEVNLRSTSFGQFILVSGPKYLFSLFDICFLSSSCRAPSLTRGRVCNLQCNDALVGVAQDP